MNKHTPGPWVLNGMQIERSEGIARTIGCVAPKRQTGADYAAETDQEAQANARLIAAAPELLDALRHAVVCAKTAILHQSSLDKTGIIELFQEILDEASPIITKAES